MTPDQWFDLARMALGGLFFLGLMYIISRYL